MAAAPGSITNWGSITQKRSRAGVGGWLSQQGPYSVIEPPGLRTGGGVRATRTARGAPAPGEVQRPPVGAGAYPVFGLVGIPLGSRRAGCGYGVSGSGAEYLQSPLTRAAFLRIDSWLLQAFAGMPEVGCRPIVARGSRVCFELRTYESHSEVTRKRLRCSTGVRFNSCAVGLGPIFYGQGLIGGNLPSLTYLLSAESTDAHEQHWRAFRAHPAWERMKNDPQYADTVSKISHRFLVPAPYSQI